MALNHKQLLKVDKDHAGAAAVASLHYETDKNEGIIRVKKGNSFYYIFNNKRIKDKDTLDRIKKLAIPPSWKNVWISKRANGHIQATGMDLNGRKQYRYHSKWNMVRTQTKFHRLYEFGKALPRIRKKIKKDLSLPGLNEDKVLATVINLMELTYIRVGNNDYEKLYGSYGLTTLKDKHVNIQQEKINFSFTGKKGISHTISVKNKKLAKIIKACRDIPGRELFQYYSDDSDRRKIDSGMVNGYIKIAAGEDFSAKDFRTWAGSLQALEQFCSLQDDTGHDVKKNVNRVLEEVSRKLGNTKNICRKYYVHPGLIQLYEENRLMACIAKKDNNNFKGLSEKENSLMQVLKKSIA